MLTVPSDWSFKKDFPRACSQAARVCVQIYISVGDTACVSDLHNQRGEAVHTYVHTVSSPTHSRIQFLNYRHFFCGPFSSHDNAEKRESSHPTPGLKHMSTGYETCKLTATPKSPASLVLQSECTLNCNDSTSSHYPPLREERSCASRTRASLTRPPAICLPSQGAPRTTSPISRVRHISLNLSLLSLMKHTH